MQLPTWSWSVLVIVSAVSVVSVCTALPWFGVAWWALSIYPVVLVVSVYLTWTAAWCELGHRPRPYFDDPKYISALVGLCLPLTWALLVGYVPAVLGCAGVTLVASFRSTSSGRGWNSHAAFLLALPLGLWFASTVLLRSM